VASKAGIRASDEREGIVLGQPYGTRIGTRKRMAAKARELSSILNFVTSYLKGSATTITSKRFELQTFKHNVSLRKCSEIIIILNYTSL
jgi:hypothetical protein